MRESIIVNKIKALPRNYIIDKQREFISRRSTVTNISFYHNYIFIASVGRSTPGRCNGNCHKASDSIDHAILCRQLIASSFSSKPNTCFLRSSTDLSSWFSVIQCFINDTSQVLQCYKFLLPVNRLKMFNTVDSLNIAN